MPRHLDLPTHGAADPDTVPGLLDAPLTAVPRNGKNQ
jgi:hypothetical protein